MLSKFCFCAYVLLATSVQRAHASPAWSGPPAPELQCLDEADVNSIISKYSTILETFGGPDFNATARSVFTSDFQLISDSHNFVAGLPLDGTPVFPSLAGLIEAQNLVPRFGKVTTLSSYRNCTSIFWRWTSYGLGNSKDRVSGISELDVVWVNGMPFVKTAYAELNIGAVVIDLGSPCGLSTSSRS